MNITYLIKVSIFIICNTNFSYLRFVLLYFRIHANICVYLPVLMDIKYKLFNSDNASGNESYTGFNLG